MTPNNNGCTVKGACLLIAGGQRCFRLLAGDFEPNSSLASRTGVEPVSPPVKGNDFQRIYQPA